jgi:outer membrane protein assembly factor BamB
VLAAGGLAAAWFFVVQGNRPSGKLDTELKGVTLKVHHPAPKHEHKAVLAADQPCWLNFGGDPQRTLARVNIHLGRPVHPPLWARAMHGYMEYPPSYCNGRLYVNTFRGRTYALDARTGRILWSRPGDGPKPSTPAIAGSRLIVSSIGGTVTAYDRDTGRTLWQLKVDAKVESSPVAIGNTVYFGATDGRLFSLDVRTGRVRWAYDTGGRINSSPSIWGRRICITTYAGSVFCLDRFSGHKLWDKYVKRNFFLYQSFYASPSTDGRRLFTISRSGTVVALRASDGKVLWTHDLNSYGYSTPAVAYGKVFVGDFVGNLHAYNAATGREVWHRYVGGHILGGAVVIGKLVFFSTTDTTNTYALSESDGRIIWHIDLGKYSPLIATNEHYYMSLNGLLVAFRGQYTPATQATRRAAGASGSRAGSAGSRSSHHAKPRRARRTKVAAASR